MEKNKCWIKPLLQIIVICCLNIDAFSANLDTLNNNILVYLSKPEPSFVIPLNSINAEKQRFKYKSKFGSYHFIQKKNINKGQPRVLSLKENDIVLLDEGIEVSITLNDGDKHPSLSFEVSDSHLLEVSISLRDKEKFFGGGIRYNNSQLNNSTFINITEENGIGRGDMPISKWTKRLGIQGTASATYYPLPFFHSNKNRGFLIETKNLCITDFEPDNIRLRLFGAKNKILLFEANSQLEIIQDFSRINGRGTQFPSWATGGILGVQGGTKNVIQKFNTVKKHGAKIEAIWVQDWVGKVKTGFGSRLNWCWQLDTIGYPSIKTIKDSINVKVLGYINPFFTADCRYAQEGLEKGFLLQNPKKRNGKFNFGGIKGYMVDLFQSDARQWMKNIIKQNLIDKEFDGWMADFGEWLDAENMLKGSNDHNQYLNLWVALNSEVVHEHDTDLFVFHRSGVTGTAKHTQLSWLGDQTVDYGLNDGLPSVITAMKSSGLSGLPPVHSDVGGYAAIHVPLLPAVHRNNEVLIDWMRLEAFTPVFRTHEGLSPERSIQVYSNDSIARAFGYFSKINNALQPYFEKCIEEYRLNGTPLFRDPILMKHSSMNNYEVYVGEDILIVFSEESVDEKGGFSQINYGKNKVYVFIRDDSSPIELLDGLLRIE